MKLVSELRRRNVFRMAVLYAVAAWLIMQVVEVVMDLAKLPDWIGPTTLGLLGVGFPIAERAVTTAVEEIVAQLNERHLGHLSRGRRVHLVLKKKTHK